MFVLLSIEYGYSSKKDYESTSLFITFTGQESEQQKSRYIFQSIFLSINSNKSDFIICEIP